ncbi:UDP-N-acetylmuramate:L-alanyl-gamma-D-glutamyl-meso-diaminopimelate ligase (Murein peptide ligase) [Candidatus Glomeribacter gigasporarum BEG34]|uniref:UDP-N-acetylmuramate--L-alanyl-gamma-D-glutamyl-meso-2,6-diaminoheptandioate ligase n=1 Tax=Candidatus Glomeribacter gigasporarum BEG34 TaxID=1070319 RepID=G2JAG4_9BURK|nr:UDP-N-acetylmuramate:L-alanyl-gamma-D-glutamyl-meso-diaminopimelate ligase (Murein peptide ligase) [Candidatus Glomeribacter gigasporarum BEG34]
MHIHILGICGAFMGGLAALARAAGHHVTGCDADVYPPMSTQLQAQGIELLSGHDPAQLSVKADLYIVGNAITRGNALMEAILDQGLPYISGPQWLAEHVLSGKWVLAVAGTHGKTTTAAMLAWLLDDAQLNPGFLVGGVPLNFGASARWTESNFFVIEADEYDTAFFDKRSKFVHYRPRTVILNNLEYDHADIFCDLAAIETQFHHLVRTVPRTGKLIVNGEDAALKRVLERGCWSEVEYFGIEEGWHARAGDTQASRTRGVVYWRKQHAGDIDWPMSGVHNQLNALAALAAARHAGVMPARGARSMAHFAGVKRRMEQYGIADGVTVYDDFAHHPSAILATIVALRARVGAQARILAVLEPRSNTMKLGVMKAQLPASLEGADLIFGYGAATGRHALGWDLQAALAPLAGRAQAFDEIDALVCAVSAAARPGDHVLIMSNGSFANVHAKLMERLRTRTGARHRS